MLSQKVALVTGAGQGIGLAIASALLSHGAKVNVVDVNEVAGKAACDELKKTYGANEVIYARCDVTDKTELRNAFQKTIDTFGKLDIVCNNAGILDEVNWRRTLEVDLVGVIEGTYLGIEFMSKKKGGNGGHIINTASLLAIVPLGFMPVYCTAKAGVLHFTRSLKDLSKSEGIFVNCVCPGTVDTTLLKESSLSIPSAVMDFYNRDGLLSPSDVADGVLQILNDEPSGAALTVECIKGRAYFTFQPEQCAPDFSHTSAALQ